MSATTDSIDMVSPLADSKPTTVSEILTEIKPESSAPDAEEHHLDSDDSDFPEVEPSTPPTNSMGMLQMLLDRMGSPGSLPELSTLLPPLFGPKPTVEQTTDAKVEQTTDAKIDQTTTIDAVCNQESELPIVRWINKKYIRIGSVIIAKKTLKKAYAFSFRSVTGKISLIAFRHHSRELVFNVWYGKTKGHAKLIEQFQAQFSALIANGWRPPKKFVKCKGKKNTTERRGGKHCRTTKEPKSYVEPPELSKYD